MKWSEYKIEAEKFAVYDVESYYPTFAVVEEFGELVGVYAKAIRKGVEPCKAKLADELGDCLWNLAMLDRKPMLGASLYNSIDALFSDMVSMADNASCEHTLTIYARDVADYCDLTISQVCVRNIAKLKAR